MGEEVMSMWTDDLLEECARLYLEGMSAGNIAKYKGLTRNQVIGKLGRKGILKKEGRVRDRDHDRDRHHLNKSVKIAKREVMDNGSWDAKLFEPWVVRKARLARERANAMR